MSLGRTDGRGAASGFLWGSVYTMRQELWRAEVSWPCAPASSALPKPMEGALASGAVTERTAGAAGENATGDIMDNISKGQRWRTRGELRDKLGGEAGGSPDV